MCNDAFVSQLDQGEWEKNKVRQAIAYYCTRWANVLLKEAGVGRIFAIASEALTDAMQRPGVALVEHVLALVEVGIQSSRPKNQGSCANQSGCLVPDESFSKGPMLRG